MLNKVQIDVLRRHVGPFIFCFLTLMFLLLMQFLILHIDKLIGKGLPFTVVIELILTNLAHMVVLAAPMAVLVASLMAFGKFSELNELTAMRAAGVNPIRVINPVLFSGVLLCIFLIWFSNNVLPDANQKARALFIDIRMKKPGFDLKPNQFYEGIEGYTFLVKEVDNENDSLYNVTLFQERSSRQNKAVIRADKGHLVSENDQQTLTLYLYDGSILREFNQEGTGEDILEETYFDQYRISFDLSELAFSRSNPDQHSRNDRTMNAQAMMAVADSLKREIDREINRTNVKYMISSAEIDTHEIKNENPALRYAHHSFREKSMKPPIDSRYMILRSIDSRPVQLSMVEGAVSMMRDYKNSFENLKVNIDWRKSRIAQYLVEVHKKISIPVACIIFVLIGAPIGMLSKKGNIGFAALFGTGFLTFFFISIIQGEKMADRLYISPTTGMWFADVVLGIAGIYMIIRICTSFKLSNLWNRRD